MKQAKKVNDFISETATFIKDLETARTQVKNCNREPNIVKQEGRCKTVYVYDFLVKNVQTAYREIGIIQEKLNNQKRAYGPILTEIDEIFKDFIKEIERVNGSPNIKTGVERLIVALNSAKKSINETYARTQYGPSKIADLKALGYWSYPQLDTLVGEELLTSHICSCLVQIKESHQKVLTQLIEFDRLKLEHNDHQRIIAETEDRIRHEMEQEMARRDAEIEELRKQMAQMKGDQ